MAVADPRPPRAWPIAAGVSAIALLVYVRTLMPGIAFGDWGEMQTVPHVLGVAHPTGYPTYVLIAWLAELLPIGSVAFRANLLSAVFVSGTLGTVALIALRLGVRPGIAAAAALALGAVGTVWAAATVSEVNPLHLLFGALLLHRSLVWAERRLVRDLVIGGLLVGLALGNHLLTLFLAPFVALFVLWAGRRELLARPWIVLAGIGAALLGLAVYAYIPLAASQSPPLPYNHPTTLDGFLWLVEGTQFRTQFDFLSPKGPGEFLASLPALWTLVVARATPVIPVMGIGGLVLLTIRRPAFGLLCAFFLLTGIYIWANYLHLEHYLLVPWLVLGIGVAVAVQAVADALARWGPRLGSVRGRAVDWAAVTAAVALVLVVGLAASNWVTSDRSDDVSGQSYVDSVFAALPADAAILSYWDASTPLWHGQLVEGLRPDVLIVDDTNIVYENWGTRERRIASLICARPVFILRLSDGDLVPTELAYRLEPFITVRVAAGGPSAAVERPIYRVQPADPTTCAG
jgi:transmembrane protein TMEM260 (protein O-mannosyltransferase)